MQAHPSCYTFIMEKHKKEPEATYNLQHTTNNHSIHPFLYFLLGIIVFGLITGIYYLFFDFPKLDKMYQKAQSEENNSQ